MTLRTIANIMIFVGWPTLIGGSIFLVRKAWFFYRIVDRSLFGKLVFPSVLGWLVTMYSLGYLGTVLLLRDARDVYIVAPTFILWIITMITLTRVTITWSKEATNLQNFYHTLEKQVAKRTHDLNEAHKKAIAHEKEIQKLRDEFIFIAAHELRSPINSMQWGFASFFENKEGIAKLTTESKTILQRIYERNTMLVQLVDRLLSTARIEEGMLTVELEAVYIPELLDSILAELQSSFEKHDVMVEPLKKRIMPPVVADPILLREALLNLITNAVRYNKKAGLVSFSWNLQDSLITFSVHDEGEGISPDDLTHIFNKFHHPSKKRVGKEKSIGLGLYITHELLQRMNGNITAESTLNKGSTFTISLPIYQGNTQKIAHDDTE